MNEVKTILVATVPVVLGVIAAGYVMAAFKGQVAVLATAHSGFDS